LVEIRAPTIRIAKWVVSLVSLVSFTGPLGLPCILFLSSKRVYEPKKGYKGYKGYMPFGHSGGGGSDLGSRPRHIHLDLRYGLGRIGAL
jgi:hypothetical protein